MDIVIGGQPEGYFNYNFNLMRLSQKVFWYSINVFFSLLYLVYFYLQIRKYLFFKKIWIMGQPLIIIPVRIKYSAQNSSCKIFCFLNCSTFFATVLTHLCGVQLVNSFRDIPRCLPKTVSKFFSFSFTCIRCPITDFMSRLSNPSRLMNPSNHSIHT